MNYGFIRAAAAVPRIIPGNCARNAGAIIDLIEQASREGITLVVFPELCVTGCTCGDLFFQTPLRNDALRQLFRIAAATEDTSVTAVVGFPFAHEGALYNVSAIVAGGSVRALVPQPPPGENGGAQGSRWFAPVFEGVRFAELTYPDPETEDYARGTHAAGMRERVPFGASILARGDDNPDAVFAVESGGGLASCVPRSQAHALAGALIVAVPASQAEGAGEQPYRRDLAAHHSQKLVCACVCAGAGGGESTTDLVFAGPRLITENGAVLEEGELYTTGLTIADIDIERLAQERRRRGFTCAADKSSYTEIKVPLRERRGQLRRYVDPLPFVPADGTAERCESVYAVQAAGLKKRFEHTNAREAVIGLSGGLDSTLALLVAVRAFDELGLPRSGIIAVTMPSFGTTDRTYDNAVALARLLGVSLREISIRGAVLQHFSDIGHDPSVRNAVYENAQARERTQILMDIANNSGAIVIGTGDLSELALGWATYNGDHMSMYGVNASVPKTLIRAIVRAIADEKASNAELAAVLTDVLDTPVSPELLPPEKDTIVQVTENIVGPYELHDFFLYYAVRWGFGPSKICLLAEEAFREKTERNGKYTKAEILRWLSVFYRRFFSQQFKRSCMPDGPRTGSVSLSPRGSWIMPSDADGELWRREIENLSAE